MLRDDVDQRLVSSKPGQMALNRLFVFLHLPHIDLVTHQPGQERFQKVLRISFYIHKQRVVDAVEHIHNVHDPADFYEDGVNGIALIWEEAF